MEAYEGLPPSTDDTMDLAARLRAARDTAGYSLARMAALTHFSKSYLGLVETGRRPVTAAIIDAYEQVLGAPIGTAGDPVRLAHEWLLGDPPTTRHLAAGRRIGDRLVRDLAARVIQLRHLDDTTGNTRLLPVVIAELDHATALAHDAAYPERTGRRLWVVVGELAQLAGWVASDAGQYRRAQQLYQSGVGAAEAAGDRALGAQLLSCLAYQIATVGRRQDALLVARSAVKGAVGATPLVRAMLADRLAWAAARVHDPDATNRALDAADDAYARHTGGVAEPEWVYWLDRIEMDIMAARCLIELGTPDQAEPLLTRALAGYHPGHHREIALYRTWLAEGHARRGDLDAARAVLDQARTTAAGTDSVRLRRRIDAIDRLIERRTRPTGRRPPCHG